MATKHTYDATEDAERILTNVLKRERFGYAVRNALAEALQRIVAREFDAARQARYASAYKAEGATNGEAS